MKIIRQFAEGQHCYARLDGCLFTPETVVLAHLRIGAVAGVGQKPSDFCSIPACHHCHNLIDSREPAWGIAKGELTFREILRGHLQWLAWLDKNGYIRVVSEDEL